MKGNSNTIVMFDGVNSLQVLDKASLGTGAVTTTFDNGCHARLSDGGKTLQISSAGIPFEPNLNDIKTVAHVLQDVVESLFGILPADDIVGWENIAKESINKAKSVLEQRLS